MKLNLTTAVLIGVSLLTSPAFAGDRNDTYHHPDRVCRAKVKAKQIPTAQQSAEMSKCMSDPNSY
jgi:hypothetical protein